MSRRPYVRPVARATWYLRQPRYRVYMLREANCVLVAFYCVLMLAGLAALATGQPERWNAFLSAQQHPAWMAFHAFSLVYFFVYQTMAWFQLAPKAMPLQLGDTVVPASAIVATHYLVWIAVTAFVFWLAGVF
jgi:fumarate reductase subunit C